MNATPNKRDNPNHGFQLKNIIFLEHHGVSCRLCRAVNGIDYKYTHRRWGTADEPLASLTSIGPLTVPPKPHYLEGNGSIESFRVVGCGRTEFASGLCWVRVVRSNYCKKKRFSCVGLMLFRFNLIFHIPHEWTSAVFLSLVPLGFRCFPLDSFCEYIGQGVS